MMVIVGRRHLFLSMYSDYTQFWLAAISALLIWAKVLYFCKLFDNLGFYVRLIYETFIDMLPFSFLLLLIVNVFSSAFYILNRELDGNNDEGDPKSIYPKAVQSQAGSLDASIFTYRIGLGDFDFDGFGYDYVPTLYLLWFFGTYVIQIVFLNMLIAIMGDTFDKVTEKRKQAALYEKIQILDDYIDLIRINEND